ncbi:hypothetical protein DAY19_11670 [Halobacteriovorax vibrionivorans]|uniref:RHS repeat-associated core domain-containing protein n=1 Tax=Halobacteriovorax vibrionivorans TaxID=2152716 RepID=A0ABY0IDD5_9BACT|nr:MULTISPECIES: RHS repeat-associated core domain-containing protein [Halobacteriovorax]RZF20637.1 hypothetical protein DAY19_11670 [Halobacteriovorax vibrionivorans]TGD48952.1 hypothetical protein EP118_02060 [Halobacteriovorax sp. Y22]
MLSFLDLNSYLYNRDYNPGVGRFMSEDPTGFKGKDLNLYRYVSNSPFLYIDPFGFFGTSKCDYYDQACRANGGTYECKVAPFLCPKFPSGETGAGNVSSCMRQCLQEKHRDRMSNRYQCNPDNNISVTDNTGDHLSCAFSCIENSENPYDSDGMDLPDNDIDLFDIIGTK